MCLANPLLTRQVRDRPRHLLDAAHRAHGEMVLFAGPLQQQPAIVAQRADLADLPRGQLRVAGHMRFVIAFLLAGSCRLYARADGGGRLLLRACRDLADGQRGDLQLHVDAIEQRPGDAREIPLDLVRLAAALLRLGTVMAAGLCCVY